MFFCYSQNTIKGGTLDLLLDPDSGNNSNQWIHFNKNDWKINEHDKRKAGLINQLQSDNKVEVCCYHNQKTKFLRLKIYVVLNVDTLALDQYCTKTIGPGFLELMLLVDRQSDLFDNDCAPHEYVQRPYLSPFDQNVRYFYVYYYL